MAAVVDLLAAPMPEAVDEHGDAPRHEVDGLRSTSGILSSYQASLSMVGEHRPAGVTATGAVSCSKSQLHGTTSCRLS
jgi:hypothetical protein